MIDFPYVIRVDPESDLGISHQIRQQITWLIATRQLKEGEPLPSVRELAEHLGINVHTVRAAYKRLENDELVRTRQGVGTLVLPVNPQKLASTLSAVRTFSIGVVLPAFDSLFHLPFLEGIELAAANDPSLLFISTSHDDPIQARMVIDKLIARNVDGLIVASQGYILDRLSLEGRNVPPIVYADEPDVTKNVVLLDIERAGSLAAAHLIEHGFKRIGLICCPLEWQNVREFYLGYAQGLEEGGLAIDAELISTAENFTIAAGYSAMNRLLDLADPPAAVVSISDTISIGMVRAIKDRALRVPQDIAIVSNGNIHLASFVEPPLTTVSAPARQMGIKAMEMLQKLIAGETVEPDRVVLEVELVVRESCGCHG